MALLCVIDTETTGLGKFDRRKPVYDDYPISLGAVIADVNSSLRTVTCVDGMYSLIRIPDPSRAQRTMMIHGILPEEVEQAPPAKLVCNDMLHLLKRHDRMHVGAWNHQFDRYFVEILYAMARMPPPALKWVEMMPYEKASLDRCVANYVRHEEVRCLDAHNAFNDCIRALSVHAALRGYTLDISKVKHIPLMSAKTPLQ